METMVFTHGDLGPRNIIFNNGKVTILDWGEAGYSIDEREFVEAKWQASQNSDWERHITDFIPDFTSQYRFWNNVINEVRLFLVFRDVFLHLQLCHEAHIEVVKDVSPGELSGS